MFDQIKNFRLSSNGRSQLLTHDEEELVVASLEFAYQRAFPWDQENLIALVTSMLAKHPKHKGKTPSRGWVRGFEKRWSHRLSKIKAATLGQDRAAKATEEVRDEVFRKFVEMLEDLKSRELFTQE